MGNWNYRLIAHKYKNEVSLEIHEVYYDEDGKPNGYTANSIPARGANLKEVKWTLKMMRKCLKKPILCAEPDFPRKYKTK